MGTGEFDAGGQGKHCDGLASHAGGMVASCYRSRDTLRPYRPPGSNADFSYFTSCFKVRESRDILQEVEPACSNAYVQACCTGQFVLPVHRHFRHFHYRHYRSSFPNLKNILMRKWHLTKSAFAFNERYINTLSCFRTERGGHWKTYSLEQRFEGQRFPIMTCRSRVWPVNFLQHHFRGQTTGKNYCYPIFTCSSWPKLPPPMSRL